MKKQKEAAEASLVKATADAAARQPDPNVIQAIVRPKGEAGDKKRGFELRVAMKLEGKEHKELFFAIQVFTFVT